MTARGRTQRALRGAGATLCVVLALGLGPAASLARGPAPQAVEVVIEDYKYQPAELKVKVGTTVRWVNREKRTSHSVIWLGAGGGVESERFFPGESYQRSFDKAGSFPYACGPHPEMKGLVIVTP